MFRRTPYGLVHFAWSAKVSKRCSMSSSPAGSRENLQRRIPLLTDLPEIVYPSITHTLRNWFFARTLITPYFDADFRLKEFSEGAKAAVCVVSQALATGDVKSLQGLVDPECLDVVKRNLSLFNVNQRSQLLVKEEDIFWEFTYQIGIMLGEEENADGHHSRHVEITSVMHTMPNFNELAERANSPREVKENIANAGGPIIVNYRFLRDFTKGVEDQWTINAINHFALVELGK